MTARRPRIARPLLAAALALSLAPAATPSDTLCVVEQQQVFASPSHAGDRFGSCTAVDGDTLAVGVRGNDDLGTNAGVVVVFVHDGTEWVQEARLYAPDAVPLMAFGYDVDVEGDVLVAGARNMPGSVYVFDRAGTTWSFTQRIDSIESAGTDDLFGQEVALSGERLLVGAWNAPGLVDGEGAAYVYRRTGATYVLEDRLKPSDADSADPGTFGSGVALEGDTALVGAPFVDGTGPTAADAGAVYVFERSGTMWIEVQKLEPGETFGQNLMGAELAIQGDTFAAGAPLHRIDLRPFSDQVGAVYVFRHDGTAWGLEQTVHAAIPEHMAFFGTSVALDGDRLAAGAPGQFHGAVHLFERAGGRWTEADRVRSSIYFDGIEDFGTSVLLQGDRLLVGSPHTSSDRGAVFDFTVHPVPGTAFCYGDGSGAACPCGNESPVPESGCSTALGRGLTIEGCGTSSLAADDLVLIASHVPYGNSGLFYVGTQSLGTGNALFDGLQCVGGEVRRFASVFLEATVAVDTGFVAQEPTGAYFVAGATYAFQYWTRDASHGSSPCGTARNFSPGYAVTMAP